MTWPDYDLEKRGPRLGLPRTARRITREQAAQMIFEQTGSIARAAVPLHGAPVARNLTGAEAVGQLNEQYADPVEARALARMRETKRLRGLRNRCLDGAEALDALDRLAAGIDFEHHYEGR